MVRKLAWTVVSVQAVRSCGRTAVAENQVVIASSMAEASSRSACLLPGTGPGEAAREAGRSPAPPAP